jgi:hypothetical protein
MSHQQDEMEAATDFTGFTFRARKVRAERETQARKPTLNLAQLNSTGRRTPRNPSIR